MNHISGAEVPCIYLASEDGIIFKFRLGTTIRARSRYLRNSDSRHGKYVIFNGEGYLFSLKEFQRAMEDASEDEAIFRDPEVQRIMQYEGKDRHNIRIARQRSYNGRLVRECEIVDRARKKNDISGT